MADETNTVDLSAVASEVEALSPEQIKEKLLAIRVRQKVQQKKQAEKGGQKAYNQKQQAIRKALKDKAIALGIYDEITKEADEKAEAKYAELVAGESAEEADEATTTAA
jgi:hypothetical protein